MIINGIAKEIDSHFRNTWQPIDRTGGHCLARDAFTDAENLKKIIFRTLHVAVAILLGSNLVVIIALAMTEFPTITTSLILGTGVGVTVGVLTAAFTTQMARLLERILEKIEERRARRNAS